MTKELAKWELEVLLHAKADLKKQGAMLDYSDEARVAELRNFLDSLTDKVEETSNDRE